MNPAPSFSARFAYNLIIICLLAFMVYVGKSILIPIGFAIMIAMLLLPVVKWLVRKGVRDSIAIILAILVAVIFVAGILYFLSAQISVFMEDMPAIKEKLQQHWSSFQAWINETFNISQGQQAAAVETVKEKAQSSGTGAMGMVVSGIASGLINLILIPIYTFLILFYRKLIYRFLVAVFPKDENKKVEAVLDESNTIVRAYMMGLLLEMLVVTILNLIGFLIIGIRYPVFLAVLAAVLNLIPYIGMLIASLLCMAVTLTTSDSSPDIIWTGAILIIVQFIDNNLIMPYIVGSKVRINALVTIVGVLIGGLLAGLSGMFLSIPVIAIMKVVFDRVESLQPWGILLGDDNSKEREKGKRQKGKGKTQNAES